MNRRVHENAQNVLFARESRGAYGFDIITGTDPVTPSAGPDLPADEAAFTCIEFREASVVAALAAADCAPITGTIAGEAFAAGEKLYGLFTSITLTSGHAFGYKGPLAQA